MHQEDSKAERADEEAAEFGEKMEVPDIEALAERLQW